MSIVSSDVFLCILMHKVPGNVPWPLLVRDKLKDLYACTCSKVAHQNSLLAIHCRHSSSFYSAKYVLTIINFGGKATTSFLREYCTRSFLSFNLDPFFSSKISSCPNTKIKKVKIKMEGYVLRIRFMFAN